jgi:colicin import membrane protein
MPFSLGSYLLGVGTVVGALAFGFGGGVLLTHTAMKETPAGATRVERVARAEPGPSPSPQASGTETAAQATAPVQVAAPDQAAVAGGQATTPDQPQPASVAAVKQETPPPEQPAAVRPDPVPAVQAETPKADVTGNALPDASGKKEAAKQPEPAKQAAKEPQPLKQVEPTERPEPKLAESREATDRMAERAKRYADRRFREIAAPRMRPRKYEVQEEPTPEVVLSRPPEQHFNLFGGFFGRPADQDD